MFTLDSNFNLDERPLNVIHRIAPGGNTLFLNPPTRTVAEFSHYRGVGIRTP